MLASSWAPLALPQLLLLLLLIMTGAADPSAPPMVVRVARRIKSTRPPENRDLPIIVSETNSRFHPMTCWFLDVLEGLHVERPLLVALDSAEYYRLKKLKLPVARYEGLELNYTKTRFRTTEYNMVVNHKWRIVLDLLTDGFDVLLSDVDIHWKKDPFPYFKTLPRCDMYLTTNAYHLPRYPNGTLRVYPPFPGEGFENEINTGFYYIRSNTRVIDLVKELLKQMTTKMDDQFYFNNVFNGILFSNREVSQSNHTAETCANYGNLTFHILPVDLFPIREVYKKDHLREDHYILHYNWIWDYSEKWEIMMKEGAVHKGYRHILPE